MIDTRHVGNVLMAVGVMFVLIAIALVVTVLSY